MSNEKLADLLRDCLSDYSHPNFTDRRGMADRIRAALQAHAAEAAQERSCTCHPDDNPPVPCPQKFAYSECVKAAQGQAQSGAPLFESDVDPKRIHDVAEGLRRQCEFESARMLDSYAQLLAASPSQQAEEPVAWRSMSLLSTFICDPPKNLDFDKWEPLYTCPQPSPHVGSDSEAKDAARYRWLSEQPDADLYMENAGKTALDAAIDAAMAQESER